MNTVPSGERAEVPLNFSNQNHIVELLHDSSIKCNEELNNISSVQESLTLPSKRGLKLASLNINDLKAHIHELKIYLAGNEIDILAINETKLNKIDKTEIVRIRVTKLSGEIEQPIKVVEFAFTLNNVLISLYVKISK